MKRKDGFALILALIVMVVVSILVIGSLFTSITSQAVSANDRNAVMAQYVSEAGMSSVLTQGNQSSRFVKKHWADYDWLEVLKTITGDETLTQDEAEMYVECSDGNFAQWGIDLDRVRDSANTDPNTGKKYRTIDVYPGILKEYEVTLPDGTTGGYDVLNLSSGFRFSTGS